MIDACAKVIVELNENLAKRAKDVTSSLRAAGNATAKPKVKASLNMLNCSRFRLSFRFCKYNHGSLMQRNSLQLMYLDVMDPNINVH